jgi:hypothetical protein
MPSAAAVLATAALLVAAAGGAAAQNGGNAMATDSNNHTMTTNLTNVPLPPATSAHNHSAHDHGTGMQFPDGSWVVPCACIAKNKGWWLNCADADNSVALARSTLVAPGCWPVPSPAKATADLCLDAFHIMQAHQDACPHDAMSKKIKMEMHAYEHLYGGCWSPPPFFDGAPPCPPRPEKCSSAEALVNTLTELNCSSKEQCSASAECGAAFQALHVAYNMCNKTALPLMAAYGYNNFEHECIETWKCNIADVPWGFVDDCGGFGSNSGTHTSRGHTTCPEAPVCSEAPSTCLPGDYDGDGDLDINDILALTAAVSATSQHGGSP